MRNNKSQILDDKQTDLYYKKVILKWMQILEVEKIVQLG